MPVGMVNLIAGRRVVPELLNQRFTGEAVAETLRPLLEDARNARLRSRACGQSGRASIAARQRVETSCRPLAQNVWLRSLLKC